MEEILNELYGEAVAPGVFTRLEELIESYRLRLKGKNGEITERDAVLITYGDQVRRSNEAPVRTLADFFGIHLRALSAESTSCRSIPGLRTMAFPSQTIARSIPRWESGPMFPGCKMISA